MVGSGHCKTLNYYIRVLALKSEGITVSDSKGSAFSYNYEFSSTQPKEALWLKIVLDWVRQTIKLLSMRRLLFLLRR